MTDNVLVLGATGKTGRRLVPRLVDRGVTVRAASRHPGDDGTGTMFDWHRPETHAPALDGADAVYLVAPERVADPTGVTGPFLEFAADAGVARLVVLSTVAAAVAGGNDVWPGMRRLEEQVKTSGLGWTMLQATAFSQNFSEGFLLPGILEGDAVVAPTGDGAVPFIDAEDIAAVAAVALTEDGHSGASYALTGPEAITFGEAAELISKAVGRPIVHHDISPDDLAQALQGVGMPDDYAAMLIGTLGTIRDGLAAEVSDAVQKVTGQPPTRFADYVTHAAAAWSRP